MCCFKALSLSQLVTVAIENKYSLSMKNPQLTPAYNERKGSRTKR